MEAQIMNHLMLKRKESKVPDCYSNWQKEGRIARIHMEARVGHYPNLTQQKRPHLEYPRQSMCNATWTLDIKDMRFKEQAPMSINSEISCNGDGG